METCFELLDLVYVSYHSLLLLVAGSCIHLLPEGLPLRKRRVNRTKVPIEIPLKAGTLTRDQQEATGTCSSANTHSAPRDRRRMFPVAGTKRLQSPSRIREGTPPLGEMVHAI